MDGGNILKWQAQVHVKKTRNFLATVTSRALKYDFINFFQYV